MGRLYKIKKLAWEDKTHTSKSLVTLPGTLKHYVARFDGYSKKWIPELGLVDFGTPSSFREDAKQQCQKHYEDQIAEHLSPAYQPSNALPTEPGHYWWRQSPDSKWTVIQIFRADTGTLFAGHKPLEVYSQDHYQGSQWIRITEPEKGEA